MNEVERNHVYIGADLRKKRKERGFSLKEVAVRMGISSPYLSDLERGNRRWSDDLKEIFENAIVKQTKKDRSANGAVGKVARNMRKNV